MLTAAQPARRPSPEPAGKANNPHVPTMGSPCSSHTHTGPPQLGGSAKPPRAGGRCWLLMGFSSSALIKENQCMTHGDTGTRHFPTMPKDLNHL